MSVRHPFEKRAAAGRRLGALTAALTLAFLGPAWAQDLPGGTIERGTLANQTLVRDAMMGVFAKVATLGCRAPDDVEPFVLSRPQGRAGARAWRERWMVAGCGRTYPVEIEFRESGPDAADWVIRSR